MANNPVKENNTDESKLLISAEKFAGPIPHPIILKGYEDILSGSADRILTMAEKEQSHEHKCNEEIIRDEFILNKRGLNYGFILAVLGLVCSTYLLSSDHYVSGTIMGGVTLVILVGQFISRSSYKTGKPDKPHSN